MPNSAAYVRGQPGTMPRRAGMTTVSPDGAQPQKFTNTSPVGRAVEAMKYLAIWMPVGLTSCRSHVCIRSNRKSEHRRSGARIGRVQRLWLRRFVSDHFRIILEDSLEILHWRPTERYEGQRMSSRDRQRGCAYTRPLPLKLGSARSSAILRRLSPPKASGAQAYSAPKAKPDSR